jgi:hypothetical protein
MVAKNKAQRNSISRHICEYQEFPTIMIVKSVDGSELEIRILGYEYPDTRNSTYDSNWLRVYVRVKSPRFSWKFMGPYLLTWEIFSIAKWLKALVGHDILNRKQEFIEPNLRFRLKKKSNNYKIVRICFSHEGRPPHTTSPEALKKNFQIDFTIDDTELKSASGELLAELNVFPMRSTDKRQMSQPPYENSGSPYDDIVAAVRMGDYTAVQDFIYAGADINTGDSIGWTPLHITSNSGYKRIAEFLITKGADVNARGKYDWTPLHVASNYGCVGVAGLLLLGGADIHAEDSDGRTPLHWASINGDESVVKFFISRGADVNKRDEQGLTPLSYSLRKDNLDENSNGFSDTKNIADHLRRHGGKE